ncbi:hypothetical protein RND71_021596 [Anisodus tanguticus]|uniref:Uncharacterized protein n=1 Tax=Anisodus tanguticus TaxID=243964 RepID=A0AAE1RXG2_9SOLA|nr:hypothetical protein RND71_021596 [Anisodus tanguticus]
MDTAETELECFRALQKQEQLAASHRADAGFPQLFTFFTFGSLKHQREHKIPENPIKTATPKVYNPMVKNK